MNDWKPGAYDHSKWENRRRFLRFLIRWIGMTLLVRSGEVEGLDRVPTQGPAIFLINHIAFVDPFMVLHTVPRQIVPLAKSEVYDYPVVGIFPKIWGVISIKRDEIDRRAIQQCLDVLRAGETILVAPEGTRSPQLQEGREGVAYLGSRSGAPVIPVAIEGTEGFPTIRYSKRWRNGPATRLHFGRPFRYRSDLSRPRQQLLRKMTDEAMYVLAGMLPEHRRGFYADMSKATQDTIEWI